jgi:chemotaxis protein MotB
MTEPTAIYFSENYKMNQDDRERASQLADLSEDRVTVYQIPVIASPANARKIWLLSFNDLMGILLTFFVLLYSMSEPAGSKKQDMSAATQPVLEQSAALGSLHYAGENDAISLNRVDYNKSLDLRYLESILENMRGEHKNLTGLSLQADPLNQRLILSLPQDLLFEKGATSITSQGLQVVALLGEALTGIKNGITVVGHTDSTPAKGGRDNWQLSIERAMAVATLIKQNGYARTIPVQGFAAGLYAQLDQGLPKAERDKMARRVDIMIYDHDGSLQKRFGIGPN